MTTTEFVKFITEVITDAKEILTAKRSVSLAMSEPMSFELARYLEAEITDNVANKAEHEWVWALRHSDNGDGISEIHIHEERELDAA